MNTANPILRACLRMGAALMVAAVLTACGGDKDEDDDAGNPRHQPQTPPHPANAHNPAAAASAAAMRRKAEARKAERKEAPGPGAAPDRGGKSEKWDMTKRNSGILLCYIITTPA